MQAEACDRCRSLPNPDWAELEIDWILLTLLDKATRLVILHIGLRQATCACAS